MTKKFTGACSFVFVNLLGFIVFSSLQVSKVGFVDAHCIINKSKHFRVSIKF